MLTLVFPNRFQIRKKWVCISRKLSLCAIKESFLLIHKMKSYVFTNYLITALTENFASATAPLAMHKGSSLVVANVWVPPGGAMKTI